MHVVLCALILSLSAPMNAYDTIFYPSGQAVKLPAPGNVFLSNESVRIPAPEYIADLAVTYRICDEQDRVCSEGPLREHMVVPGAPLPVGWYRVCFLDAENHPLGWTTAAILSPLETERSMESPVAVDVAVSWLATDTPGMREGLIHLAAMSGVSWVRDRLRWREIQPAPDTMAPPTKYDDMAQAQAGVGLKVLQVFHDMPQWARGNDNEPVDLRRVFAFCRDAAKRFVGAVPAWESWNEANAHNFGGWPVDRICSWQKAAFLGFKSGRPETIVCMQPLAGINTPGLAHGVIANETWPYFDVYTIHSYDWDRAYGKLWAPAREAAAGRPIWVTESDRGIQALENAPGGELAPEQSLLKAQFIAQSYASSMAAGASRHFHFILSQYMEGRVQFGLLREDLTPRPAYVALATVARLLAGTKCLGSWSSVGQPDTRVVAFREERPGGGRDVLAVWAEMEVDWPERGMFEAPWPLPETMGRPTKVVDYLGRTIDPPGKARPAVVFVEYPLRAADQLALTPPPATPKRAGAAVDVVLQAHLPQVSVKMFKPEWTEEHDYVITPGETTTVSVYGYNFGEKQAAGKVMLDSLPEGWTVSPEVFDMPVAPGERGNATFSLTAPADAKEPPEGWWITLRGDFGGGGRPVVALRIRLEE